MGIGPGSFGHFKALGFEALGLCGALEKVGPNSSRPRSRVPSCGL